MRAGFAKPRSVDVRPADWPGEGAVRLVKNIVQVKNTI